MSFSMYKKAADQSLPVVRVETVVAVILHDKDIPLRDKLQKTQGSAFTNQWKMGLKFKTRNYIHIMKKQSKGQVDIPPDPSHMPLVLR